MSRSLFYIFLILCFLLGVFFKQFDLFYPKPFVVVAFCGAIGLLAEYASRIRDSWFWLVPALLASELIGDLIYNAQFPGIAFWLYIPGALLFPVYGILFIRSGLALRKSDRGVAIKFIVLGILAFSLVSWEYVTYYPESFDPHHLVFQVMYLATFAWLLLIDYTTDFSKRPHLKIERQILRLSLMVIAAMIFIRFVFK